MALMAAVRRQVFSTRCYRYSCSPFVEPPVALRVELHNLHLAECPLSPARNIPTCHIFLYSTNSAISISHS